MGGTSEPGFLEQRLVVVEAVGIGEKRQGAANALVLRVVARCRWEDVDVDLVPLEVRGEIDPPSGWAEDAHIVGLEGADHVRDVAGAKRGDDLVVDDAADDRDLDVLVLRVVLGDDLLELDQLMTGAPADPERQLVDLGARSAPRERPPRSRVRRGRPPLPQHVSSTNLLLRRRLWCPPARILC